MARTATEPGGAAGSARRGLRLRLRHLMIAVAAAAVACWLVVVSPVLAILVGSLIGLPAPGVLAASAWGRDRRVSAACFVAEAAVGTSVVVLSTVFWMNLAGIIAIVFTAVGAGALTLALGASWAAKATRRDAEPRRHPLLAWLVVLVLAGLPASCLVGNWPLRVAFAVSRPSLDRVADRVAAGRPPREPVRAGLYRVLATDVDPTTGNVGLVVDTNPAGRSGFMRMGRATGPFPGLTRSHGPFWNLALNIPLGGGWRYQTED